MHEGTTLDLLETVIDEGIDVLRTQGTWKDHGPILPLVRESRHTQLLDAAAVVKVGDGDGIVQHRQWGHSSSSWSMSWRRKRRRKNWARTNSRSRSSYGTDMQKEGKVQ